jgi:hypothetical protein
VTLLDHIRDERGPLTYAELVRDCELLGHLPKGEHALRVELSALVRAGLVTWSEGVVCYVPTRAAVVEDRQGSLFG